jgi:deazaflavin-dependent oxidoreductase (nitroreductase family)
VLGERVVWISIGGGGMAVPNAAAKARAVDHVERYRRTDGADGGTSGGHAVLLLTTTGRISGRRSTVPLNYFPAGDELLVVASSYGLEVAPDWYHNLAANPLVRVQVLADTFDAVARTAGPEERARLWQRLVEVAPFYGRYQAQMRREIPLVLLKRA